MTYKTIHENAAVNSSQKCSSFILLTNEINPLHLSRDLDVQLVLFISVIIQIVYSILCYTVNGLMNHLLYSRAAVNMPHMKNNGFHYVKRST